MSHAIFPFAVSRFVSHGLLGSALHGRVKAGPRAGWRKCGRRAAGAAHRTHHDMVTSLADAGPGTSASRDRPGQHGPGPDTITFAPAVTGTITLSSALPDLSTSIILTGPVPRP